MFALNFRVWKNERSVCKIREHTDLLAAIPCPKWGVDVHECEEVMQLRREVPPAARVLKWCVQRFRFDSSVRIILDNHGSFFWKLLDGERSLHQISERMSQQFSLEIRECEHAVLLYTKMLMRRHFLDLILPPLPQLPETEPPHA